MQPHSALLTCRLHAYENTASGFRCAPLWALAWPLLCPLLPFLLHPQDVMDKGRIPLVKAIRADTDGERVGPLLQLEMRQSGSPHMDSNNIAHAH